MNIHVQLKVHRLEQAAAAYPPACPPCLEANGVVLRLESLEVFLNSTYLPESSQYLYFDHPEACSSDWKSQPILIYSSLHFWTCRPGDRKKAAARHGRCPRNHYYIVIDDTKSHAVVDCIDYRPKLGTLYPIARLLFERCGLRFLTVLGFMKQIYSKK